MTDRILSIVRAAGDVMLGFENPEVFQKEGHANFVTKADMEVQAFLLKQLHEAMPEASFFAEEQENEQLTDAPTFLVDPIDGTTNFMRGRKCSSISVALLKNREPVLAAILNPYTGELFHAEKGRGACMNGKPIHVSGQDFSQALVTFGTSPYNAALAKKTLRAAEAFLLGCADLRRTGSAAIDLCDIACGRGDIFWELQLSPWDFAAGSLLVSEAGGKAGCPGRGPFDYGEKSPVLAANTACYEAAERILPGFLDG